MANPARKFKSDAFEAIHSAVSDLREARMITAATLREYDQLCITPPPLSALQIRALRRQLKVSQPVFAAFLNTTPSTIVQWESGKKRPSGMGLKLLQIAKAKGLQGLAVGDVSGFLCVRREVKRLAALAGSPIAPYVHCVIFPSRLKFRACVLSRRPVSTGHGSATDTRKTPPETGRELTSTAAMLRPVGGAASLGRHE